MNENSTGGEINNTSQTEYQQRYLAHQQVGKKDQLIAIMQERRSQRQFANTPVPQTLLDEVTNSCRYAPSSCDRFGVRLKVIADRDQKALLDGLLVGGVGWIYRAPVVILLLADPVAYQAGNEVTYMPYIDAGILIQQMSLAATSLDLRCAYANPNIRPMNIEHFKKVFKPTEWQDIIFCGALAIGFPHPQEVTHERNLIPSLVLDQ